MLQPDVTWPPATFGNILSRATVSFVLGAWR
jgi:hypothetical protein